MSDSQTQDVALSEAVEVWRRRKTDMPGHAMTLRDQFAMSALAGIAESLIDDDEQVNSHTADWAYRLADAMLEARQK